MRTRFKGYDAKDPTAASRLRRIWSGGCFASSLAFACTPVHDLDAYAARESTGAAAAGSGAVPGAGDDPDAGRSNSGGASSDETQHATLGGSTGRPSTGSLEDT